MRRTWGSAAVTLAAGLLAATAVGSEPARAAADLAFAPLIAEALQPVTLLPAITGTPRHGLTDGATVVVEGSDVPPGEWSLTQCAVAFLDDPSPAQAAALCGPRTPVAPDAGRRFTADVVVHDPLLPAGGGTPRPCGNGGCAVVLVEAATPAPGHSRLLSFGPPTVTVTPEVLFSGGLMTIHVVGAPPNQWGGGDVRYCAYPLGETGDWGRCSHGGGPALDDAGNGATEIPVWDVIQLETGTVVDCRVDDCGVALFDGEGRTVAVSDPVVFSPRPVVTIAPSSGLLDGEPITVTGQHLQPGEHRINHCHPRGCGAAEVVTVGPSGTLSVTVPAVQRFTNRWLEGVYCRADCQIVLDGPVGFLTSANGYALAEGELAVAPDAGLGDGQVVQVGGDELMASYDGPALLGFGTGGWVVTQCDVAVLDDPTLFGVFTHCSGAQARAVEVPGSTLDAPFPVAATITRILGGTTDCTTGPGACVVGLVRFEQDASLSHHLRPVTFG